MAVLGVANTHTACSDINASLTLLFAAVLA